MRVVKETRRYWLPLCAAVLCLIGASFGVPPLVAYALIMLSFGFCFDAATAWLARAGRHRRHAPVQAVAGRPPPRTRTAGATEGASP